MLHLEDINLLDFYFNGHYLSEFEGVSAGKDGLSPFSSLPFKEIITEKIPSRHGELFYSAVYNPRTFVVPLTFKNLQRLREISGWLSVTSPTDFYFDGDTVKIKVMIDGVLDFEHGFIETKVGGMSEIKLIAYDPFFYKIKENPVRITSPFLATNYLYNDGNFNSLPLIKIEGTGNIILTINSTQFAVNDIDGYVYIDSQYFTAYKVSLNKLPDFAGFFPELLPGKNTISISGTGTCTALEIQCRSRWI